MDCVRNFLEQRAARLTYECGHIRDGATPARRGAMAQQRLNLSNSLTQDLRRIGTRADSDSCMNPDGDDNSSCVMNTAHGR